MSNRVMTTLRGDGAAVKFTALMRPFVIDGVRNCRDLTDFGREIRATVLKRTHLTVGVAGVPRQKTLAKLANHAAKVAAPDRRGG